MKTSKISPKLAAYVATAVIPLTAYSVNFESQIASDQLDSEKYSLDFNNCVIDSVLEGIKMKDAKSACFKATLTSCEFDAANSTSNDLALSTKSCLNLITEATKYVIKYGKGIECDSGHCTIVFE